MEPIVYLDANATEIPRPELWDSVIAAMQQEGNPSSIHRAGRAAKRLLEDARDAVATRFGVAASGVVFTSGGTEACALAIHGLAAGRRLAFGATEHDAVRQAAWAAAGAGAAVLPVRPSGAIDLDALRDCLAGGAPALVCLMLANNETGVCHPIAEAAALCHHHGAILHVDAVQAASRLPVDLARLGADSVAISGHKMGAPLGAGALLLGSDLVLPPLIAGGGQERGRRGGTPALPAIVGLGAACALPIPTPGPIAALRDRAAGAAIACGATVLGEEPKLPNTVCLALPGAPAERQVILLDLAGIAVSAGSACSSGKVQASHVLAAMGAGELAGQAIRVSLPWCATEPDIDAFIDAYRTMAARLAKNTMAAR